MAVLRTGAVRFGAVAMAMALAGCSGGAAGSGGGSGDAGNSAVPSSAVAAGVELDPQMQEFLALDVAGQEAALAELSMKLERQLWTETGMEAELGGPAATDTAYNALATAFTEQALRYRGDPAFGRFGAHVAAGSHDVSLGGLTFGGYVIAGLAAKVVESSNEVAPGKTPAGVLIRLDDREDRRRGDGEAAHEGDDRAVPGRDGDVHLEGADRCLVDHVGGPFGVEHDHGGGCHGACR
ncbi:MAG: hypothetical protein NTX29_00410 [Actinobacteria bacterium]|nr:hypothetical protein [Actinomycetota bacterium]